ncbi:hypothetical protein WOLCODRAFT_156595 [Wolfiporia cocos MD-104 SS10]|uniref:Uncharacterized protein n=1 Tax=Wolfiporia cocos (strain MD-104) TaxID=742152 RepID=A0A2H3J132_WOLCO|nr:hypothetical protein WOLCODRAFT_156595 [Wolfiporia cocos MD-104 SS10]
MTFGSAPVDKTLGGFAHSRLPHPPARRSRTSPLLPSPVALVSLPPQPRVRASCPPRAYADVPCVPRATVPASAARASLRVHTKENALASARSKGCVSSRDFWPDELEVMSGEDCALRPHSAAALTKDIFRNGWQLLIGGYSCTPSDDFSPLLAATCLRPGPGGVVRYAQRAVVRKDGTRYLGYTAVVHRLHQGYHFSLPCLPFPQLYLYPSSPLLPALSIQRAGVQHHRHAARDLPPGGPASRQGGARGSVCRAVHDKQSRDERKRGSSADAGELRPLFSGEMFQSFSPSFYVRELLLVPASLCYGKPVVSTGGHCTTTLLSGLADASLPANGAENEIVFCGCGTLMGMRAVQAGEMDRAFESVLASLRFPDIHFLPIDRSARMRDCLHIMTGAGMLEGWTDYIWRLVSRELPVHPMRSPAVLTAHINICCGWAGGEIRCFVVGAPLRSVY